jgi:hypothetical protein
LIADEQISKTDDCAIMQAFAPACLEFNSYTMRFAVVRRVSLNIIHAVVSSGIQLTRAAYC